MKYLLWKWREFRLFLMMRDMSIEERKAIINEIKLEAVLEQYSQSLRRVR